MFASSVQKEFGLSLASCLVGSSPAKREKEKKESLFFSDHERTEQAQNYVFRDLPEAPSLPVGRFSICYRYLPFGQKCLQAGRNIAAKAVSSPRTHCPARLCCCT